MSQFVLNKKLVKFLLYTGLLYGAWLLAYEFWLKPWGQLDKVITENITYFLCVGLEWFGYKPHYNIAKNISETYIYLENQTVPIIRVGASCNGLELLVLFVIFIICYPSTKTKWWFIILGLGVIHVVNIVRNFILTLMAMHRSPYFDLFHRYIFIFLVYGVIFTLWLWWTNNQNHESAKK